MQKPSGFSTRAVLAVGLISLQYMISQPSHAACVLTPGIGNDTHTCNNGSSTGFTDPSGDNSLVVSTDGTINGNVTFGSGMDKVEIHDNGVVTGVVQQGAGIDDFLMTGGQILALFQGDGLDTFRMTGGRIVDAFEDGDMAYQSGGTIGRVNMKLDKNYYEMIGGIIEGNLVTGFDVDTIRILKGLIGGNISTSGGDDSITIGGGKINGEIRASVGNDTFQWLGGGQINSSVLMGDGNDTALLQGLSESTLAHTPSIDGGLGNDQLTFDATTSSTAARYIGWETVNLTNNSRLDLAGDFFLGDSGSNTGTFNIDGSSTLAVTQGDVRPYGADQQVTLNNGGIIDMTADNRADSVLKVHGNYIGNGQLHLQTVLGDENSATDKLVVADGSISGHTQLSVSNLGGVGGLTQNNGIEVVQALNGAVSSNNAFGMSGPASAGAYQYFLFKGGVTAGTQDNWYLRSSVAAGPKTTEAAPSPQSAASNPPLPTAIAGAEPIPLYRQEVPIYSVNIPAAQKMTLQDIGTFHERQGDQSLLTETGVLSSGWARAYGSDFNKSWSGTVAPSFDGTSKGYQVGHDLYASETSGGQTQRFGLFIGQSRLRGDVKGFALGWQNHRSGRVKLDGDNFGAYSTLTGRNGGYVDVVAMGTRLEGDNKSDRGVKMDIEGHALALSVEAGYPFRLSEDWVVEPQVQVIGQKIDLDSQHDGISRVSFDSQEYWTGRLGARLKGRYLVGNTPVEPYLRANVWHTFGASDTVTFDEVNRIKSDHKSSTADIGVGAVAKLSSAFSVYMEGSYGSQLDDNNFEGGSATVGMRMSW